MLNFVSFYLIESITSFNRTFELIFWAARRATTFLSKRIVAVNISNFLHEIKSCWGEKTTTATFTNLNSYLVLVRAGHEDTVSGVIGWGAVQLTAVTIFLTHVCQLEFFYIDCSSRQRPPWTKGSSDENTTTVDDIFKSRLLLCALYISLTYAAGMRRLRVIIDRRACCFCSHYFRVNVMQGALVNYIKKFMYTKAAAWRDVLSDAEEYKDQGFFWILRPIQTWSLRMCFPHDGCLKLSLEFTHYTCLLAPFNCRRICDFSPTEKTLFL